MFQTEFATHRGRGPDARSPIEPARDVVGVVPLVWEEHCTECAFPICYTTCSLYRRRADGNCARFADGIEPVSSGHRGGATGGRMTFLRWAKLEAALPDAPALASPVRIARFERTDRALAAQLRRLVPRSQFGRVAVRYGNLRRRAVARLGEPAPDTPDALDIEIISAHSVPFRLTIETSGTERDARTSVVVSPGHQHVRIPVAELGLSVTAGSWPKRLIVTPEDDLEVELTFLRLELVWLAGTAKASLLAGRERATSPPGTEVGDRAPTQVVHREPAKVARREPAASVKVVVWDLDETLWNGTLVEDGIEGLTLRDGVAEVMGALDARGVLQSVVSKNDAAPALAALERFGLADLVLAPQIGWGAKSEALTRLAAALDLGIDTFLLVDDSAIERAEVVASRPSVRVVDPNHPGALAALLTRPELDQPVTEESRRRREMYRVEAARRALLPDDGDHDAFLRRCELALHVSRPRGDDDLVRCHELFQRTNQLNLTTRRLTRDDLDALVGDPATLVLTMRVQDRFGSYGLVGVAVVDMNGPAPELTDLVTSCRVARKGVEPAFVGWLVTELRRRGAACLVAPFRPTSRNHVLREVLDEIGFRSEGGSEVLTLRTDAIVARSDIVTVTADI